MPAASRSSKSAASPGSSRSRVLRRPRRRAAQELPSYRGDIVNGPEFTAEARIPDPARQIEAYRQSAATLNLIRAFATGGYADLERVHQWNMGFVKDSPQGHRYQELADRIAETLQFMRACGITSENTPQLRTTNFYTSHEALLLGYEQALTRKDSTSGDWYATSGHMIWVGDRTRQPDHAHIEYLPRHQESDRLEVRSLARRRRPAEADRPSQSEGRAGTADADLPLRLRQGRDASAEAHPRGEEGRRSVIWSCDPMHGNTISAVNGYKTRPFDRILKESLSFFEVHRAEGTHAGGIHVEMTGQNVTECTGGATAISEQDLVRPLPHALRSAAQRRSGPGTGFPGRRATEEGTGRRCRVPSRRR